MLSVTPDMPACRDQRFTDWLERNGIRPTLTARVDIEGNVATVFAYCEQGGRKHLQATCPAGHRGDGADVCMLEPYDTPVGPLPEGMAFYGGVAYFPGGKITVDSSNLSDNFIHVEADGTVTSGGKFEGATI